MLNDVRRNMLKRLEKIYKLLLIVLPGVLFFSYYPLIRLGTSESMDFELSLPLIWLLVFDLVVFIIACKKRILIKKLSGKWAWLLLPAFLSVSILWSPNRLRGLLVVGILWLIYFAGFGMYVLKDEFKEKSIKDVFWKFFFGSALVVCVWCVMQCFLDVLGVPREYSLMCEGCTYKSFGFPHPNGFAVEPQFMGNLLLAPAIMSIWFLKKEEDNNHRKFFKTLLPFVFVSTLFLTFSRGAIYAFVVAMIFMTMFLVCSRSYTLRAAQKHSTKLWVIVKQWVIIITAFLFTLNLQGIMAQISPTNDNYYTGITKVLNHLSLGIIDVGKQGKTEEFSEKTQAPESREQIVEKPVENFDSDFDGYVSESTEIRVRLSNVALELWSKDIKTILLGVGLGGAGQALYENGLIAWPKEIVQNQYISLLLETGLIGIALLVLTIILTMRALRGFYSIDAILVLTLAYGVSLLFFSGLPNAIHIYLLPIAIFTVLCERN